MATRDRLSRHGPGRRRLALALRAIVAAACLVGAPLLIWPQNQIRLERVPQGEDGQGPPSVKVLKMSAAVDDVAWSPDSKKLAVLSKPGTTAERRTHAVLLYDLVADRQDVIVHESTESLISLRYWPGGMTIGCARWRTGPHGECEIAMWNPTTVKSTGALVGAPLEGLGVRFTSDPLAIAVSPDGRFLAAGTKLVDAQRIHGAHIGGEVCVWDLKTGRMKWFDRTTHTDSVNAVEFSSDGTLLATGGIDKLIRLWDPETGKLIRTLTGVAWHGVNSLAIAPDAKLLASGGTGEEEGGTVRIWDIDAGLVKHVLPAFRRNSPVRLAYSPDGQTLLAVGHKRDSNAPEWRVHAWDPASGRHKGMLLERPGHARTIAVSPDGKQLAIGTFQGEVVVIDLDL